MALKKTSKEEILKHSIKLFKIQGYYNTSMADIAAESGLIKGSIYHYFKSKDEIGLESLKYIHKYFEENIYAVAYKDKLSDKKKITLFVEKVDEYFLHSEGGCLLGNLALEVSSENLAFKQEIQAYFLSWERALASILSNSYSPQVAQEISKEFVALTQGTIMMMTLHGDKNSYLKVGQKIINLIK